MGASKNITSLKNVKIKIDIRENNFMIGIETGRNRINDTQMAFCYLTNGVFSIITANPKDFEIFESFEINDYR